MATFESREVRDAVRASSKNLAGCAVKAGIRLHVPGFLSTNFKLLENLGYQMKSAAGGVRRVIKFDDENQDLMLDVKIGDQWKRIRPPEAQAAKRSRSFVASSGPEEMSSGNIADFFASATRNPAAGANTVPMQ